MPPNLQYLPTPMHFPIIHITNCSRIWWNFRSLLDHVSASVYLICKLNVYIHNVRPTNTMATVYRPKHLNSKVLQPKMCRGLFARTSAKNGRCGGEEGEVHM